MSGLTWKQFLASIELSEEDYNNLPSLGPSSKAAAQEAWYKRKEHEARMQQLQQQPQQNIAHSALLQSIRFDPVVHQHAQFRPDGFGPFVVRRQSLLDKIVAEANPYCSVHVSGCKGSGKTTLLKLIGKHLVENKKDVYFLKTAGMLNGMEWTHAINSLIEKKQEAYFLVDETQSVALNIPTALILLLKNEEGHNLTIIGAGVPDFKTLSASFSIPHRTGELFLSKDDLQSSGVLGYFGGTPKSKMILEHIRDHCGGHIYPLMRGMEVLQSQSNYASMTAQDVIAHYESPDFRRSEDYKAICSRVLPAMGADEIRPLFYSTRGVGDLEGLRKKGFVSQTGDTVLSHLLLDAFVAQLEGQDVSITKLGAGLEGIKQVLCHSLPGLRWSQYDGHGGPVEDALTFELLSVMAHIRQLTTRLFNPKLVDVGTSGRRPDIYLNSQVNSYIECLLTEYHRESDVKSLDEHIDRFCAQRPGKEVHYTLLEGQDFAILNFQKEGMTPLNPSECYSNLFDDRVFTFLMARREVYLGNQKLNVLAQEADE